MCSQQSHVGGGSGGAKPPPVEKDSLFIYYYKSQSHVFIARRRVMSLLYVAESCLWEAVVLPLTRGKAFVRTSAARC